MLRLLDVRSIRHIFYMRTCYYLCCFSVFSDGSVLDRTCLSHEYLLLVVAVFNSWRCIHECTQPHVILYVFCHAIVTVSSSWLCMNAYLQPHAIFVHACHALVTVFMARSFVKCLQMLDIIPPKHPIQIRTKSNSEEKTKKCQILQHFSSKHKLRNARRP